MKLSKISLKVTMLIIVLLTTIFLTFYNIKDGIDMYKVGIAKEELIKLVKLSKSLSLLIHETQKERGMSAGYLGSGGKKFKTMLPAQRETTDSKIRLLQKTLNEIGITNVNIKCDDGFNGWKEYAPFDAIIVTCAPDAIPQPLINQLADNGRMIIPVGGNYGQELIKVTKKDGKLISEKLLDVIFVPMTGKAQK